MKLKKVTYYNSFFKYKLPYNILCDIFVLFNEKGYKINKYELMKIPNYLNLKIIDTIKSTHTHCGINYDAIHIKLNTKSITLQHIDPKIIFGQPYTKL